MSADAEMRRQAAGVGSVMGGLGLGVMAVAEYLGAVASSTVLVRGGCLVRMVLE
jgi:hypothetical protein